MTFCDTWVTKSRTATRKEQQSAQYGMVYGRYHIIIAFKKMSVERRVLVSRAEESLTNKNAI